MKAQFDLASLVRKNILSLKPYSSARDEFSGSEGIFLDANENPFGTYNRYPDPRQKALKKALSELKDMPQEQIFIGNGSDEVIDLIFRVFGNPGTDSVIICPPTYGMYEVSANINDIRVIPIPLRDDFQLDIDAILERIRKDESVKLVFVCSPNNPTGNTLRDIDAILDNFNGIVVIDEAYIDFCPESSHLADLRQYPNLIVMQTFSKAWALAGARVGIAYAQPEIIALLNKTKPPYNVSKLNKEAALKALSKKKATQYRIATILEQKKILAEKLPTLSFVKKVYPSDANFLLVEMENADAVYTHLIEKKVITRNRSSQVKNCIRITVGSPKENRILMNELKKMEQ
jgi:histidinol-phosphate aminotransferase